MMSVMGVGYALLYTAFFQRYVCMYLTTELAPHWCNKDNRKILYLDFVRVVLGITQPSGLVMSWVDSTSAALHSKRECRGITVWQAIGTIPQKPFSHIHFAYMHAR